MNRRAAAAEPLWLRRRRKTLDTTGWNSMSTAKSYSGSRNLTTRKLLFLISRISFGNISIVFLLGKIFFFFDSTVSLGFCYLSAWSIGLNFRSRVCICSSNKISIESSLLVCFSNVYLIKPGPLALVVKDTWLRYPPSRVPATGI